MPTYPFICKNPHCKAEREELASFSEYDKIKNSQRCHVCGTKMRRLFEGNPLPLYCDDQLKTVGQQAERNKKAAGQEKFNEIIKEGRSLQRGNKHNGPK